MGNRLILAAAAVATVLGTNAVGESERVTARSRDIEVYYRANQEAEPLLAVELWYSRDGGASWEFYGLDEDRRPPVSFLAPEEGSYGLFLVIRNAVGPSSTPPVPGTEPHLLLFVDATPPVVQLHDPRLTAVQGDPTVQIRWTAIDAHLPTHPIDIEFKTPDGEDWQSVSAHPVANIGRFDWHLPPHVQGLVSLRVRVHDLGGNLAMSAAHQVQIPAAVRTSDGDPKMPQGAAPRRAVPGTPPSPNAPGERTTLTGSRRSRERARELFDDALRLRDQGALRSAVARLRQLVALDPQHTRAFTEMAELLRRLGDSDRALQAYEIALLHEPDSRSSLMGAAGILTGRKDYESAARYLRTILRYSPDDAEVWMHLGDLAVYRGDEAAAREHYARATEIKPDAVAVVAQARERLAIMDRAR